MRPICIGFAGILLMAAGCSARVDATNEQTLKKSMEAVTADMTAAQKAEFGQAVAALTLSQLNPANVLQMAADQQPTQMMKPIDGLTAQEILDKAKALRSPAGK